METITEAPKLLLIVDHSSAGSSDRFHALYHACVESIEHLTDVAIQLRTKLKDSAQETALIKPLTKHHQEYHPKIPLHINALSAELDSQFHQHLCRTRWQRVDGDMPQDFSASLDDPRELEALLQIARPQFIVVGPLRAPRSKSRPPIAKKTLLELQAAKLPVIGVGGVTPGIVSDPTMPACDGYAILTPVLNALDAPQQWRKELVLWKPFLNGETT